MGSGSILNSHTQKRHTQSAMKEIDMDVTPVGILSFIKLLSMETYI